MAKVAKAKSTEPLPDEQREIARLIGRAIWQNQFTAANPDADAAAKKADWEANRNGYVKIGKAVVRSLERKNIKIVGA